MPDYNDYYMTINGGDVAASDGRWIDSEFPYTREAWCRVPRGSAADAKLAVDAATTAFRDPTWSNLSPSARGKLLFALADTAVTTEGGAPPPLYT